MSGERFSERKIRFDNGSIGRRVAIPSANPVNYHQMVSAPPSMPRITVDGLLFEPPNKTGKVPLVIVVPGSLSVAPTHLAHAETFTNMGYASFVLDPFGARGVTSTVANQMQFSFAASAYDVMAAVRELAGHDGIDARRIGLQGHSRGGTAVLAAVMRRLNAAVFGRTIAVRAVLAAYPWCGHQPLDPDVGATEIRVLIGERDDWVSPQQAQGMVQAIRLRGGAASIRLFAGAGHSFDRNEPLQYFADAAISPHAPIAYLADDGAFIHPTSGSADPALTDRDIALYGLKAGFGGKGATIGSRDDQPQLFRDDMIAFFARTLGAG
jgi:dienelactone hydrolase